MSERRGIIKSCKHSAIDIDAMEPEERLCSRDSLNESPYMSP